MSAQSLRDIIKATLSNAIATGEQEFDVRQPAADRPRDTGTP